MTEGEKPRRRPRMTKIKDQDVPRLLAAAKALGLPPDEALSIGIRLLEVFARRQGTPEERAIRWGESFIEGDEFSP